MTDTNISTGFNKAPSSNHDTNSVHIFDRNIVRLHRTRAAKETQKRDFGDANFLFMEVADRLVDRLMDVQRQFDLALDLGCHSGEIHHWLQQYPGKVSHLLQTDMAPAYAAIAQRRAPSFVAEEDLLPVKPASLDLVISNLSLHWVNDLPGAFAQIRQSLKPDGLFQGVMLGGETLCEMRSAIMEAEMELLGGISPRVSPMADLQDIGSLMQRAGFSLPVLDSEIITVTYDNLFKLAADLRNMGESNAVLARQKKLSPRKLFMRAAEIYAEHHSNEDGRISASFILIYMHGWAPDPSQQQPAQPGSGQTSLVSFLTDADSETPTGENE